MNLQYRIDLLVRLGEYILQNADDPAAAAWQEAKEKAGRENAWFIPEYVEIAANTIAREFLRRDKLEKWVRDYQLPPANPGPKTIGIVMAGNIPLVGFHDFLCVFICGHRALVKSSSRDEALIRHLVQKLTEWEEEVKELVQFAPMLRGCDAYIATGSNNSAGYFEYYFGKFPHIIRRNRTSVAILTGRETADDLHGLADDVFLYFGLGCRNVTKLYVPEGYDFRPLLDAFRRYDHLASLHKYKHNYDYNLAIQILNKKFYMSTPALLLVEEGSLFSPIGQLNYEYYSQADKLTGSLASHPELQCIVGEGHVPFGRSQFPSLTDYADGEDTLAFVSRL